MSRPNATRVEKTANGRLKITILSDSERDISAVVDPEEFSLSIEMAMSGGEGPLVHGEHEDDQPPVGTAEAEGDPT